MKQFKKEVMNAVLETKEELKPFLERLDFMKISAHNRGYLVYSDNPVKYFIDAELIRYLHTSDFINSSFSKNANILDVGFFIPVVPIVLSKLGFKINCIEKLSFYQDALDEIILFTRQKYGVEVFDFDLLDLKDDDFSGFGNRFDLVLLLAVLEHLNGTPKYLFEKVKRFMKPDSRIIVEVPNISTLSKRLAFLIKGKFPYPCFDDYFHSDYPFSGHNREYSINDLKYVLDRSGFELTRLEAFHHSILKPKGLKSKILYALELMGPRSWKPSIWAVGKRKDE